MSAAQPAGPVLRTLLLPTLRLDAEVQMRASLDEATVNRYAECFAEGVALPPVVVFFDDSAYWLADGFHRYWGAQKGALKQITAEVRRGGKRDAILYAAGANDEHGLPRTNEDKRRAVGTLLRDPEWSQRSDRWIAEACRVGNQLVGTMRRELADCVITQSKRTSKDGRQRPAAQPSRPAAEPDTDATEQASEAAVETYTVRPAPTSRRDKGVTLAQWAALHEAQRAKLLAPGRSEATFNRQDSDAIEWAEWSWNPVTGCKHDCPYCYARDITQRFTDAFPTGFAPTLLPARLTAPANMTVPAGAAQNMALRNVFTCSMADLFGRWVPREWIEAVLAQVRTHPEWNFLFLTKFPKRYAEFTFPENAWLGTTVDCQARVAAAEAAFAQVKCGVKWLSIEPMIEPLEFTRLELFDWLVLGGASRSTRTPEWHPPACWWMPLHLAAVERGLKVYWKANLIQRERRFPGDRHQEITEAPEPFHYLRTKSAADVVEGERA
jgi:protein gp37/ParB-like chromosome segregation protein Spo0J